MSFRLILCFVCTLLITNLSCIRGEYNFTDAIAKKCKEYICSSGYNYQEFFRISPEHRSNVSLVELHIAIRGMSDGHVMLSSVAFPNMTESVYELVIGAGNNTYTVIRRMRKKYGVFLINTPNIITTTKYTPFWIKISKDGVIQFGKEGNDIALLTYRDPTPLDVNYFSFAAWSGVEIRVLYDCPFGNQTASYSEAVVRPKSPETRLKEDILKNYTSTVVPISNKNTYLKVFVHYDIRSLSFDVTKSQLKTHGHLTVTWIDLNLGWNASDYNLYRIFFKHNEIWEPELILFNTTEPDALDPGKTRSRTLTASYDGTVTRVHSLHITTLCSPSVNLLHWPRDTHECFVDIGLWSQTSRIKISGLSDISKIYSGVNNLAWFPPQTNDSYVSSEWELVKIEKYTEWMNKTPMVKLTIDESFNTTGMKNVLRTKLFIGRSSTNHTLLYYTPFVAITIMVLLSFWLPSSYTTKLFILGFNLILVTICLSEITFKMPAFMVYVPNIVQLYIVSLITIIIGIVSNVLFIKMTTDPKPWPKLHKGLKKFLKSPVVIFDNLFSEEVEYSSNILNSSSFSEISDAPNFEPLESENDDDKYWKILISTIEKIILFILMLLFAILSFTHY